MRFTCLDVSVGHTHLAAGSAEFIIKVVEIADSSRHTPYMDTRSSPRGTIGELMDMFT